MEVDAEDGGKVSGDAARRTKRARTLWGTTRTLVATWSPASPRASARTWRSTASATAPRSRARTCKLQLGYSHDVDYPIPAGVTIKTRSRPRSSISGADQQQVGQVAAEIREFRQPEPYKGKGIKYDNESILRKEGKKK